MQLAPGTDPLSPEFPLPSRQVGAEWYAVYTTPRWEKKISQQLLRDGYVCYCPLQRIRRKWKHRHKIVFEPIFRGYLFVHISPKHRWEIMDYAGALNFVRFNGKPAVIRAEEIELIKRFLGECEQLKSGAVELIPGDKVEVTSGVFVGLKGEVVTTKGGYISVYLDSMGMSLRASIHRSHLIPMKEISRKAV